MVWLSLEAYAHPRTIGLTLNMFDAFGWWQNDFFKPFAEHKAILDVARVAGRLPALARNPESCA